MSEGIQVRNAQGVPKFSQLAGGVNTGSIDQTITAGESLGERDAVYIDPATGTAFKIDQDASPVACGAIRGFVTSASIGIGASGTMRVAGALAGFSGLTTGGAIYAATTPGTITQTRPTVTAGGGQRVVVPCGWAINATTIMIDFSQPVQYLKRENLADDGTVTIAHHSDPLARARKTFAYLSTTAPVTIAEYPSSNQDFSQQLRGSGGAGATTTVTASGTLLQVGTVSSLVRKVAQSFTITEGRLSQFSITWGANTGSPTGTVTWEIRTNSAGSPSTTVLQTGTFTPVPSTTQAVTVADGIVLQSATTYWLVLYATVNQAVVNNHWSWQGANPGAAAGSAQIQDDAGAWNALGGTWDVQCTITTAALTVRDKLAQGFQIGTNATVDRVNLWLRKVGSPTGTMTLRIETNSAGSPSGTLANAAASVTLAESGLGTSYASATFNFATDFGLLAATQYWVVLSTDRAASSTNYVQWGVDSSSPTYPLGEMKGDSSGWVALSADGCFEVFTPDTTYDGNQPIHFWSFADTAGVTLVQRFDDGVGGNGATCTTFKNASGQTLDVTWSLELP